MKFFHKLSFLFVLFILMQNKTFAQWAFQYQNFLGSGIDFYDNNNGIMVGTYYSGSTPYARILKTTDAGASFTNVPSFTGNIGSMLEDIFFHKGSTTGYACGYSQEYGIIYKTTDGGNSWSTIINNRYDNLKVISFASASTGYCGGGISQSVLYKTTNAGATWLPVGVTGSESRINDIFFLDSLNGFIASNKLIKTNDGGLTWTDITPASGTYKSIHFWDEMTGLCIEYTGKIYKTFDGGLSWHSVVINNPYGTIFFESVKFLGETIGYVCGIGGSNGILFRTTDGGETWNPINSNTNTMLYDLDFTNDRIGVIAGFGGYIRNTDAFSGLSTDASVFLKGYANSCSGDYPPLHLSFTGTPPFNISYTDGINVFNINGINTYQHTFTVSPNSVTQYVVTAFADSKGNSSYIGGKGIINANAAPTAKMRVADLNCSTDDAHLILNFTGCPPWAVTYSNGIDTSTINNIYSKIDTITINVNTPAIIKIISVSDKYHAANFANVSGQGNVYPAYIPITILGDTIAIKNTPKTYKLSDSNAKIQTKSITGGTITTSSSDSISAKWLSSKGSLSIVPIYENACILPQIDINVKVFESECRSSIRSSGFPIYNDKTPYFFYEDNMSNYKINYTVDKDGNLFYTTYDSYSYFEIKTIYKNNTPYVNSNLIDGAKAMTVTSDGSLIIANFYGNNILQITPSKVVTPIMSVTSPYDVTTDKNDNIYILNRDCITKISSTGVSTVLYSFANWGTYKPVSFCRDTIGNFYVLDNWALSKIDTNGTVLRLSSDPELGNTKRDGPVNKSVVVGWQIRIDIFGNLIISDGPLVRMLNLSSNIISTISTSGAVGIDNRTGSIYDGTSKNGLYPQTMVKKIIGYNYCPGENVILVGLPFSSSTTFQWSNGQTESQINVNETDSINYSLIITDTIVSCYAKNTVKLIPFKMDYISKKDTTLCTGSNFNILTNIPSRYFCEWTPSYGLSCTNCSSPSVSISKDTTYYVDVHTECGIIRDSIRINALTIPPIISTPDKTICFGDSVQIGFAQTSGYTFSWTPTIYMSNTSTTNPWVKPLAQVNYSLTATSSNGCKISDDITVFVDKVSFSLGPDKNVCSSMPVSIGPISANGSYYYRWIKPTITNNIFPMVSPTETTKYIMEGKSNVGCTNTDTIVVYPLDFKVSVSPSKNICSGSLLTLKSDYYDGASYGWRFNGAMINPHPNVISSSPQTSGTYIFSVSYNGCLDKDTVNINVLPTLGANLIKDVAICNGCSTVLNASTPNVTSYLWKPGNQTTSKITVNTPGTYRVIMSNGTCSYEDTIQVHFGTISSYEESNNSTFQVYPNPTSEKIIVTGNFNNTVTIEIINSLGEKIFVNNYQGTGDFTKEINTSHFHKGLYTIVIKTNLNISSQRLILY